VFTLSEIWPGNARRRRLIERSSATASVPPA
jgi:hypothetical protein